MKTRIKICGLTRAEDVEAAVEAGADALGFVFYPASPRAVSPQVAARLIERVPPLIHRVGLFVDAGADEIDALLAEVALDLLQFHGNETEDDCLRHRRPYLKAIRMRAGTDLLECGRRFASADGLLLDTYSEGYGGSGLVFDWSQVPAQFPRRRMVLSGGLTAENVVEAMRRLRPAAVDVSSGVEEAGRKGCKDKDKIRSFVAAVRSADDQLESES